jgi:hypothetical protein
MLRLQARLSAAAIVRALEKEGKTVSMDTAFHDRSWPVAGTPLPSPSIRFGMTLVMAIACGVAAANITTINPCSASWKPPSRAESQ